MLTDEQVLVLVERATEAGFKFFAEKKYPEAEIILGQVLKVNPDNLRATQLMGLIRHNLGRFEEAIEFFSKALECDESNAENHNNISLCYSNLGRYEEARPHILRAVELAPRCNYMHGNLGLFYRHTHDIEKAIESFKSSLLLNENDPHTWCMLGGCYGEQQRLDPAERCFIKALDLDPRMAPAHMDLANIFHMRGELERGFAEYEWRFECYDQAKFWLKLYDLSKRWYGEEVAGKRIILHSEQGIGDSIHFFRYVPLVKALGATVIVHCQDGLAPLFASHVDEVYTTDPGTIPLFGARPADFPMPQYDYFASLMSLPYLLQNPPIPKTPYLATDRKINTGAYSNDFKIGIVWAGNPQHPNDANRSCRLSRFRPIHDIPGVKLFSLQKDVRPRMYRFSKEPIDLSAGCEDMKIIDMATRLGTFEDTAAILRSLDLLITVDTSIIHLAGSMDIETWGLIPYNTDWRWGLAGERTEWYPSVRLFRQPELGDWDTVFDRIVETLIKEKINGRR